MLKRSNDVSPTSPETVESWFQIRQQIKRRVPEPLRKRLNKVDLGVFALRVVSLGLSFIIATIFARLLGVEGYGTYAYTMAWTSVLVIPANLGLPAILTRETAAKESASSWGTIKGLFRWSAATVVVVSTGIALGASLVAWPLLAGHPQSLYALWLALASLPFTALMRLRQASLQGLRHITLSQVSEQLVRPILLLVLVTAVYWFGSPFNVLWVVGFYTLSMAAACLSSTVFLRRVLPPNYSHAVAIFEVRRWLVGAAPFLFISGMYVITTYTDILMLGILRSQEEAGIYAAVNQGAQLVLFSVMTLSLSVEPFISKFYAEARLSNLQRFLTDNARVAFFFTLPLALALIAFGHTFLSLFGPEFSEGRAALTILCLGYLTSTIFGFASHTLSMTKFERMTAVGIGAGALLNVVLNYLLIPHYGVVGAAIGTSLSFVFRNLLYSVFAKWLLGLNTTIFSLRGFLR